MKNMISFMSAIYFPHSNGGAARSEYISGNDIIIYSGDGGPGSGIKGHTTPKLSAKDRAKYDRRIIGQKTSSGTEIKSFSEHSYQRIAERGISPNRVLQMLAQTPSQDKTNPDNDIYRHNGSSIVINRNSGNVVTVMWSGK
ncbi:hypothetical protein FACS1894187_07220 [Synergistales bacterium]|nr:hypothetical protein FACS1894187_07220 [Synergistales bacterium]